MKFVANHLMGNSIKNNPSHLPSILLFGSIGVLDHNDDILGKVIHDLYAVRANKIDETVKDQVDRLLRTVTETRVSL